MSELKWQEHEVVECLGVLPVTEEYFTSHTFEKNFGPIRLLMTIWQNESQVALSLFQNQETEPYLTFQFIVRDRVEFVSNREFASLRFHDVVVVTSRFWLEHDESHQNWFDKDLLPTNVSFELVTFPRFEFKVI